MSKNKEIINESDIFAIRRKKLNVMRENGIDPFRMNCEQKQTSKQAIAMFVNDDKAEQPEVSIAGRIVVYRLMGKASFIKLLDRDGRIQCYISNKDVGDKLYSDFAKYDIGDIVGVTGKLFKTKTNEITVRATKIVLVSKSLRPLPEKWHGLTDNEQIYRQRYLDLIVNDESRKLSKMRCDIICEIRRFLWAHEFTEVETPMLQNIAGGAAARPFITYCNALDQQCYIRIALELYLKRMLVSGFDRVFEIGRVFRNEGLSRKHNPEFTMIELYQAYTDHKGMMVLVRDLIQHLCEKILGTTKIVRFDGVEIDLGGTWNECKYTDLVIEAVKDPMWFANSKDKKFKMATDLGVEVDSDSEDFEITNAVYSKLVEPNLLNPTFVTQLPKELCPLAKLNKNDERFLDVFELCINGQEIAPAYSEQNDPFVQRKMFEDQIGEDKQNLDNDFLLSLEYGMPPAGGMGIGIDRLIILLTGAANIRDVILFPTMRIQKQ